MNPRKAYLILVTFGTAAVLAAADGRAVKTAQSVEFGHNAVALAVEGQTWRYEFRRATSDEPGRLWHAPSRGAATPLFLGDQVVYSRGAGITERYRATERGFQQQFIIQEGLVPKGESLALRAGVQTSLQAEDVSERSRAGLYFLSAGQPVLHFGPARATDAKGVQTELDLEWANGELAIHVDGTWLDEAAYPVTVDTAAFTIDLGRVFPANKEDGTVWRVQLRLVTADVASASTDDNVWVQLNGSNLTYLDYSRNDFERNTAYYYDLNLTGIRKLADITQLRIAKNGSDGWCLRMASLYINGKIAYSLDYGASGRWLDNNGYDYRSLYVGSDSLRANYYWKSYALQLPPMTITNAEIVSRIEAIVGHEIHGTDLHWGFIKGGAVELTYVNSRTIHVNLDLAYDIPLMPDVAVDARFDITFGCEAGRLTLATKNADFDIDSRFYSIVYVGIFDLLQWAVPKYFGGALGNITFSADSGASACPDFYVKPDASVYLWGF